MNNEKMMPREVWLNNTDAKACAMPIPGLANGGHHYVLAAPTVPAREWSKDATVIARLFHDLYEELAPQFGYETRIDTKQFDPASKNGMLMVEVCGRAAAIIRTGLWAQAAAAPDLSRVRAALDFALPQNIDRDAVMRIIEVNLAAAPDVADQSAARSDRVPGPSVENVSERLPDEGCAADNGAISVQHGRENPAAADPVALAATLGRAAQVCRHSDCETVAEGCEQAAALIESLARGLDLHHELLYAVARKFPGETRHETALRYIREAEAAACIDTGAKMEASKNG